MKTLIVGLGNPGDEYTNTRHNAGFLFVEFLAELLDVSFKNQKKLQSEVAVADEVILCKPQTFMNNSGMAVRAVAEYYDISPDHIFVAHDDSDIAFGNFKIHAERGAAGHKGILSIDEHLKSNEYTRIRIGVRPEENKNKAETFVLKPFSKEESIELQNIFKEIEVVLQTLL